MSERKFKNKILGDVKVVGDDELIDKGNYGEERCTCEEDIEEREESQEKSNA